MQFLSRASVVACLCATALARSGAHAFHKVGEMQAKHAWHHNDRTHFNYESSSSQLAKRPSQYLNKNTRRFEVDGTNIPDVDFDVGESYAGRLPISNDTNENSELFFWFFPSTNPKASDEITVWFNGGPGCSSLSGLLTENGPFTYMAGTIAPTQNPYSWNNLTNMVWVEQPVGVGFSTGTPDIRNERQLAAEFLGFWKNFMTTFGMEGRKVYITGESYGGFYVPYVANAMVEANDDRYYNMSGVAINDPILGDETVQQAVPIVPFVDYWSNLFSFNQSFTDEIHMAHRKCGYEDYYNKYLTFPPPQMKFPNPPDYAETPGCDTLDSVYAAVQERNPCFNIYHITDYCPFKESQLGIVNPGDYDPPGSQIYFARKDVQRAINAPMGTNWTQCTMTNVFGGPKDNQSLMDQSLGPAQNNVLSNLIEKTNNVLIGVGDLDFLLPTNGSLLAIQNMTWNGAQGFSKPPNMPFYVPYHPEYNQGALADAGLVGKYVTQRGLTFYTVQLAGHEMPGYTPGAGYRVLEKLLGRIPSLNTRGDFSTQNGDYTGESDLY